jgi:hypothetical protein
MSKEIESISAALFDKIRSRFANVTLGDESAKAETDPSKARFFNFTYSGEDGAEFGTVTISLIDETSLKVYYGQSLLHDMDREHRKEWYEFLRNLRKFAKRNLLTFDTRDINKSNLNLKDIKQQAKVDTVATTNDVPMTESKLYGTSMQSRFDMDNTRLRIHHESIVNDDIHGDRSRKIKEMFIETSQGERFLVPFKNLVGAKALTRHINEGGAIHDDIGQAICNMVSEMSAMKHFVRSTKNRQFEDVETTEMTESAIQHFMELKNTLKSIHNKRHYHQFKENFIPDAPIDEDLDIDALRERFVKKVYDDRFNDALPIVYKAHKRQKTLSSMVNEFDSWTTDVTESTWSKPDTADKINALRELLKQPLPVGMDGIDAETKIEEIIGDDDLNDKIFHLFRSQGPDADARTLVKEWLVQNMPNLLNDLEVGEKNAQDASTNWTQPISPEISNNEYGSQPNHPNVSNMAMEDRDPLQFIRNLAGLK